MYDTTVMKRCSKGEACCHPDGSLLPATREYFYADKNRLDGLRVECKSCNRRMMGRIERPKYVVPDGYRRCSQGDRCLTVGGPILPETDEFFAWLKHRGNFRPNCRACRSAQQAKWIADHPEWSCAESYRRSKLRNADKIKARKRQARKEHPEREKVRRHRRTARELALDATFTNDDWLYGLKYFHYVCAYCGNPPSMFDKPPVLHQEHHIPTMLGGAYTPLNIVPACQNCNLQKNAQEPNAWLAKRFKPKQVRDIKQRLAAFFASVRQDGAASGKTVKRLTKHDKALIRITQRMAEPSPVKRCSCGDKCVNPLGPMLPATNEYFSHHQKRIDGFDSQCKMCVSARQHKYNSLTRVGE